MNEVEFRIWLTKNDIQKKVQGDIVSRIRRIEREIEDCDVDEHYREDRCEYLMSLFKKMGVNEKMKSLPENNFPVGKYYMSTFRYALKYYIKFCDETHK